MIQTLSEFGGYITLKDNYDGGLLQSMDWDKCKGTNEKIEPSTQIPAEERFTLQKSITIVVYDHDIPRDLIINLD